jgi:flagellar protein FlbD
MIIVTRLNNRKIVINAELIKFVEETPDTTLTLRDGAKILVKESADRVVDLVIHYARAVRSPFGQTE